MPKTKKVYAVDLFCGAGGSSSGLRKACTKLGLSLDLLAINHWDIAIATHSQNHPNARHLCENLDSVDPRRVVPKGKLNILIASPECTGHSRALGGKPKNDQSRATAWHVLRWAEALRIENILIENVEEFRDWGPLGSNGLPLKRRKGETYQAFLNALRSLGYVVEDRLLNCANYGDPTTRSRLFILAKRGRKKIAWPDPTHTPTGESLFGQTAKWHAAREVIDWTNPGTSIFNRKRPLSPNTLKRIEAGLKKFGGQAFLTMLYGSNDARSVDRPLPTVTAKGNHIALAQPFILNIRGGDDGYTRASSIDDPLPTVTATSPTALVQPFIIPLNHGKGDVRSHSIEKPMPTITSVDAWGLVEPFLVEYHGGDGSDKRVRSVDAPLPTQDTSNRFGLCQPFVLGQQSKAAPRSVNEPLPTVAGKGAIALVQPFLLKYNGTGGPRSIEEPVDTLTSKERFGIVLPEHSGAVLDIRFRMLTPRELARAMSFPDDYKFAGNREQTVKQIGNAVPGETAAALCLTLLAD